MPVVWEPLLAVTARPEEARRRFAQLRILPDAAGWLRLAPARSAQALAAVLGGSTYFADLVLAHPEWLAPAFEETSLIHGRRRAGLAREAAALVNPAVASGSFSDALGELRRFKQREHLRLVGRDFARFADVATVTRELSDLAEVCLDAVFRIVRTRLMAHLGEPWHCDTEDRWQPTSFAVIGLGKLGGAELNHSSDVDVLCVYAEEGSVFRARPRAATQPSDRTPASHAFFQRLAEALVAEVSRIAPEGQLYRMDLRLRPEGEAGPLARALGSYEVYYAQWGQTWERLMLLKARPVAGDLALGAEFLELIQSFRYPRSLNPNLFREIAATKRRLETEVVEGDLERDVKRGRGGIREIEFIVQSLQLLNGGRQPFLQTPETLAALPKLRQYGQLTAEEATGLADAYRWLRDVEHRIQLEHHRQTHALPVTPGARQRLARLMDCRDWAEFTRRHGAHRALVNATYAKIVARDAVTEGGSGLPDRRRHEQWITLLGQNHFRDPSQAWRLLQIFLYGPGYAHISARTEELAGQLVLRLLAHCPGASAQGQDAPRERLSDPDRVLARLDSFVTAYGARTLLYETWASNPQLFTLLLLLFDRSEHLANLALKIPDLVEDLLLADRLRRPKSVEETLAELRFGAEDADQLLWLRRYHQAEQMRIGLRDLLGSVAGGAGPFPPRSKTAPRERWEDTAVELTTLAEGCLRYAVEAVQREARRKTPPFAVLGLGKLGGAELSFGSDLDLIFIASDHGRGSARAPLLAARMMELLGRRTESGFCFECDARLRPHGEKGLLVTTFNAAADYYARGAGLWELQALSRARWVAGDAALGRRFLERVDRWTDFSRGNPGVAAWTSGWVEEIVAMQQRIAGERTPQGQDALAFKTGTGGLVAAEFLAQTLGLALGWREPNTLRSLERAGTTGILSADAATEVIAGYRALRRLESILRRWSFQSESVLPVEPAAQLRVARRCGFASAEALLAVVAEARQKIARAAAAALRLLSSHAPLRMRDA